MAVIKISDYAIGENFNNVLSSVDDQRRGKAQVSLTNYDMGNTTKPQIAGGSIFECSGALYEVTSDTSANSPSSDGICHIYFHVSSLTFYMTPSWPVWDDERQGFYHPTSTNDVALPFILDVIVGSSIYGNKRRIFINNEPNMFSFESGIEDDTWIYFAHDANFYWDESDDVFKYNKGMRIDGDFEITGNLEIGTNIINPSNDEFYVAADMISSHDITAVDVKGSSLKAVGDIAGTAGSTSFTNTADLAARSSGQGTIFFNDSTNRSSKGFIKIYIGTTAYYIPVFDAI